MATGINSCESITNEQIQTATGNSWDEWCSVLDEWGAENQRLVPIVHHLVKQYHLAMIWAQVIAVYYKYKKEKTK